MTVSFSNETKDKNFKKPRIFKAEALKFLDLSRFQTLG
ncbi:hypothetical protein LEP1GSC052_0972 [Leptospira kmetyi serovar Malaysia str. Bejo-Iso9]|nr:hypothetical protein LEP1GSC052_0972 [Leptospira kmetyi serovar Malaysia str. Bejo-Iso9]